MFCYSASVVENSSSGNKKLLYILLALAIIAGAAIWYLFSRGQFSSEGSFGPNDSVAVVNGEEIIGSEVEAIQVQVAAGQGIDLSLQQEEETLKQLQTEALNSLIAQTLLRQDIENLGIVVADEEIDDGVETIRGQFESRELYEEELSAQNVTENELRDQIKSQLEIQNYLASKTGTESLTATDSEVEEFYNQSVSQAEDAPPLEEIRPQIAQIITQQKRQQELQKIVQQLRLAANIEILI